MVGRNKTKIYALVTHIGNNPTFHDHSGILPLPITKLSCKKCAQ